MVMVAGPRRGGRHTPAANGGKWLHPSTRWSIYLRDGFRCVYCKDAGPPLTIDHVKSASFGTSSNPDNLVTCCQPCNSAKKDAALPAWLKYLQGVRGIAKDTARARIRSALRKPLDREVGRNLARSRREPGALSDLVHSQACKDAEAFERLGATISQIDEDALVREMESALTRVAR